MDSSQEHHEPLDLKQDFRFTLSPTVASIETHTMGESLFEYLRMKVHLDIQERDWDSIIVKGCHSRSPPSRVTSIEKRDKPFNWQRPTTSVPRQDVLELQCFPGLDYVKHYAAIVATYLALQGKSPDIVSYTLPTPRQCMEPLLDSNLKNVGIVDIAVLGYVGGFGRFATGVWQGESDNELFAWQITTMPNGCKVAFIGCKICFWGDIGGNVVRALQLFNKVKCTLYLGKLGSLQPDHKPNTILATGNRSMVKDSTISWTNVLADAARGSRLVKHGIHYSLPSILDETKAWLEDKQGSFDWVDPEIGQMAQASVEGNTDFGFLHIVSDNIARKYPYDLSNERLGKVLENRKRLLEEIELILNKFFTSWDSRAP